MAGETEVVIHGIGMDLTPQNNFVKFSCFNEDSSTSYPDVFGPELDRK